jgi:hypothetical protein
MTLPTIQDGQPVFDKNIAYKMQTGAEPEEHSRKVFEA